jgi:lysophospholipase L1-like esterase
MPQVMVLASGVSNAVLTANEKSAACKAASDIALTGGSIGFYKGYRFYGEQFAMVFYARELSADETLVAKQWAYRQFKIVPQVRDRLVILGDSIVAGTDADPAQPWSRQMQDLIVRPYKIFNQGCGGITAEWFDKNYATNTEPLHGSGGIRNVLLIAVGTNDVSLGASAAATYGHLSSIIRKAKATGFGPIGIGTILPRQNTGRTGGRLAFEVERQALNALIVANAAGADFIVDVGSDPTIGTYASSLDKSLYVGALHLTAKGAAYYAEAVAKTMNALLQ